MKPNRAVAQVIVFMSVSLFASQVFAAPPEGRGKGGKPGSGDGASDCFVKMPKACGAAKPVDLIVDVNGGFIPKGEWAAIFRDDFDLPLPSMDADQSGSFNFNTWSSRFPYGDVKVNKPSGDTGYNVNTTGIEPGKNWVDNIYPDYDKLLKQLDDDKQKIFSNSGNALTIQTFKKINPWKNNLLSRKTYYKDSETSFNDTLFSGLISSHADPANRNPHGFEFRYGYVEAKVKLPTGGNGFRSAVWLHSDNSFYNQYSDDTTQSVPQRFEIDFLEYLPNSREASDTGLCFRTQSDVFGISDNDSILTYDTIFHTYHFPIGLNEFDRSPNNWTFNAKPRYEDNRCSVDSASTIGIDYGDEPRWHVFGVLWEHDTLEFYVDGVKVHSVLENPLDTSTIDCTENTVDTKTCKEDVFDSRMYIVASMHMGFQYFEGNTIDMNQFNSITGDGPKLEIDYIKVLQKPETNGETSHLWCGAARGNSIGESGKSCGLRENREILPR